MAFHWQTDSGPLKDTQNIKIYCLFLFMDEGQTVLSILKQSFSYAEPKSSIKYNGRTCQLVLFAELFHAHAESFVFDFRVLVLTFSSILFNP